MKRKKIYICINFLVNTWPKRRNRLEELDDERGGAFTTPNSDQMFSSIFLVQLSYFSRFCYCLVFIRFISYVFSFRLLYFFFRLCPCSTFFFVLYRKNPLMRNKMNENAHENGQLRCIEFAIRNSQFAIRPNSAVLLHLFFIALTFPQFQCFLLFLSSLQHSSP